MRPSLALVALVVAAGAGAQPVVLADGRSDGPAGEVYTGARPAVSQATAAASTYWRNRATDYEEEILVMDVAEGAFTRPGARQQAVLYLMSAWPRCCPKMGVAFIEDDRLVLNVAFEGTAQTLDAAPDLNGDDRDELVFTGEFGMGGQVTRSMTLTSFGPAGPEDIGWEMIYDSSCGAGAGGGTSHASRVLANAGFELSVERFTQPCDGGAWVPTAAAERLVLEPASDLRYVELPVAPGTTASGGGPAGGRREAGRLEPGDQTLTSGEFVDRYELECRAGQMVVLDLRATDFDPYLIFRPPAAEQIDNDDHEGDRTHSRIEATPAQSGSCDVLVTSYQPGERGAYELTISE